jgi:hypothetical protein
LRNVGIFYIHRPCVLQILRKSLSIFTFSVTGPDLAAISFADRVRVRVNLLARQSVIAHSPRCGCGDGSSSPVKGDGPWSA